MAAPAPSDVAFTCMSLATAAILLADNLDSALMSLAATAAVGFFAIVGFMYGNLQDQAGRLSELVTVGLCAAVGLVEFLFFVLPTGGLGMEDDGRFAQALPSVHPLLLPAAATVVFFLGAVLVLFKVVHIRAGGEGGGGKIQAVVYYSM